ncbi:hypothetical protein M1D52_20425 [Olivibacter sp. SA151]|uniref:hypothetical protein n=1 Tax=Olivibacter jilunii TaxID=985016 RepID=UPI003F16A10C
MLIEIATSLRVLDDQFRGMNSDDEYYKSYKEALASVNMDAVILFNDADANLRWIYNKIIHSESFITFSREGVEAHETDYGYNGGMVDKKEVIWHHYDLHVRLAGTERRKEAGTWAQVPWHLLLIIVEFTNAIFTVLNAILIIKK